MLLALLLAAGVATAPPSDPRSAGGGASGALARWRGQAAGLAITRRSSEARPEIRPARLAQGPRARETASGESEDLVRRLVAETALAQLSRIDPAWEEPQRDCAGLVRFAFRSAFKRLDPERAAQGPFHDASGRPSQFADAATLLRTSFAPLGRGEAARAALRSGDLVAFAREDEGGAPVYHLMLVVRADDPAHGKTLVVYHPGEKGAGVRAGALDDLARDAPGGWRPIPENPLFLGFYRLKEWSP
jgi:uncharacterized protein YfaT (DUF1175 family)